MLAANTAAHELISSHPAGDLYFSKESGHHYLNSVKDYQPGDIIEEFSSAYIENLPNRFTVQKNEHEHIVLHPKYLQYLNHSCDPNCFIDVNNFQIIAIKPIEKGVSLNFFYPSTEWKMSEPFKCLCGSYNCLGEIKGAYAIPLNILNTYKLSPFIESRIRESNQNK
jgi:hypothetical protein